MPENNESDALGGMLSACEEAIGYRFGDRRLLERCLTHASVARTRLASNERLEFLGDAILGAVVCEMLFENFPEDPEGEMTRMKSVIVSRQTCARISIRLGLERFLLLGKGLTSSAGAIPQSIMAAVLEALIAGVHLDGGVDEGRAFVRRLVAPEIVSVSESERGHNYKSLLQQSAQKLFGETPIYRLLDEKGPDHSKCFNVAAVIGVRVFPDAWGPNKKEAEQSAARNALQALESESP